MLTSYKYIGVEINDGQSVMYASIFDAEIMKLLSECNPESNICVEIWVKSKNDLSA